VNYAPTLVALNGAQLIDNALGVRTRPKKAVITFALTVATTGLLYCAEAHATNQGTTGVNRFGVETDGVIWKNPGATMIVPQATLPQLAHLQFSKKVVASSSAHALSRTGFLVLLFLWNLRRDQNRSSLFVGIVSYWPVLLLVGLALPFLPFATDARVSLLGELTMRHFC
jgi:hypothetical protein